MNQEKYNHTYYKAIKIVKYVSIIILCVLFYNYYPSKSNDKILLENKVLIDEHSYDSIRIELLQGQCELWQNKYFACSSSRIMIIDTFTKH